MSNHLDWTDTLSDGWQVKPLRAVADSVVSNVDKLVSDDEIPVRLCNYTDVYHNEFIGPDWNSGRSSLPCERSTKA